jgi:NAD dependent epimerase/dehydratase
MELSKKSILVTGADGFIGSHLTEMIVKHAGKVKALNYYNSFNHWGWLEDLDCLSEIEVLSGDIRDPHYCKAIIRGVDVVFHLAALIAIPYSYIAAQSYVDTNVKGTLNICQGAIDNECERLIHTSTSEVYGTAQYVPIDEKHPLQAQSPYSASKIGADSIAISFFKALNLPLTIARPFNTYGPRQSTRAVIPTIITQIASGKKKIDLGDLSPTRDFNYVADTCRGIIALAKCDEALGMTINIGSNREVSIGDLFELIKKIMESDAKPVAQKNRFRPRNSEVFRLWCDNSKIRELTGFLPECSLRDGLTRTIQWYKNPDNLKKFKTHFYNV